MRILLSAAALTVCFASAAFAQSAERRMIGGSVLAQDPVGDKPISRGFTQGSGGVTPRQAAGLPGPIYIVRKHHITKRYR